MRIFLLSGLFLFLLLSDFLQNLGIPIPAGSRHLFIFIFILLIFIISKEREINIPYFLTLILLLMICLFSYLINDISPLSFAVSTFISLLFAYAFLLTCGLSFSEEEVIRLSKIILFLIIFASIPALLNYLLTGIPVRLNAVLFREAGALATANVLATIISLSLNIKTNKNIYFYIAIILSLIILIIGLKKSIASVIFCWSLWCFLKRVRFYKFFGYSIIFAVLLSPIYLQDLLLDIQNNIDYLNNVGPEGHIRIGMYLGAYNILSNNIFWGSGLGTFGSLGSIISSIEWPGRIIYGFSPIYYEYGLIGLAGVNESSINNGSGTTYLDTFWPHIFAELGLLGSIPFLFLWFYPLSKGLGIFFFSRYNDKYILASAFVLISTCIVLTWEGLFLIQPEVPLFIFLHSIYTGALLSSTRKRIKDI